MGSRADNEQEPGAQPAAHQEPFYVEGYGFVPPSQVLARLLICLSAHMFCGLG